jgi:hypothetical protein
MREVAPRFGRFGRRKDGGQRSHPPLTAEPASAYDANVLATGCSAAWLARLPWEQEVTSSNLVTPTYFCTSPWPAGQSASFLFENGSSILRRLHISAEQLVDKGTGYLAGHE